MQEQAPLPLTERASAPARTPRRPRATKSIPTAARRLAERLGYRLESTGRSWKMYTPKGDYIGTHSAKYALGSMIAVAVAPTGYGFTYAQVAEICALRIVPPKAAYWWETEIARMQRAQAEAEALAEKRKRKRRK